MNESLLDDFRVQCEWIHKLHPQAELRRRFANRTFDETFAAVGRKLDPAETDSTQHVWLGFMFLCDSKYLDDKFYWLFD